MRTGLAIILVSALAIGAGCKKNKTDDGGGGGGSGTAAMGSGTGADPGSGSAAAGSGSGSAAAGSGGGSAVASGCMVKIKIGVDAVDWTIDGAITTAKVGANGFDGAELRAAAKALAAKGPCSARIGGDADASYQVLITAMDVVVAGGIKDVGLDIAGDPAEPATPASAAGKDVKAMPIVVITKDAVTVDGKDVAKLDDTDLEGKLGPVLAAAQSAKAGTTMILQADIGTTYGVIAAVVTAGKSTGYEDVLFAVKNK